MSVKRIVIIIALICVCASPLHADESWKVIAERSDFKLADRAAVLESAYEELANLYGQDIGIDALKNARSYVNAVRSDKYKAEMAAVLIEDRNAGEANCYYEVAFDIPSMDCMSVGSVWIDGTLDEYLDSLIDGFYAEIDESGTVDAW